MSSPICFLKIAQTFRKANIRLSAYGFAHGEVVILDTIQKISDSSDNGVKVTQIAKALGISVPAVSKSVNSLERKGFISRIENNSDRRVTYIKMTEKGYEHLRQGCDITERIKERVEKDIGHERFTEFFKTLHEIPDIILDELNTIADELDKKNKH